MSKKMDGPPPYDPDDYDLPADPLEDTGEPSGVIIDRVRKNIAERGGREIPGRHEDRYTEFEVTQNGATVIRNAELSNCGHEACFVVPPNGGGKMITACVVCDAADRWPRFEEVA